MDQANSTEILATLVRIEHWVKAMAQSSLLSDRQSVIAHLRDNPHITTIKQLMPLTSLSRQTLYSIPVVRRQCNVRQAPDYSAERERLILVLNNHVPKPRSLGQLIEAAGGTWLGKKALYETPEIRKQCVRGGA